MISRKNGRLVSYPLSTCTGRLDDARKAQSETGPQYIADISHLLRHFAERSFSLANLSATRRTGLRFVKAVKTDEEWTRESRAGIDSNNLKYNKTKTSREIAEENARWYRELVSGSSSGTATREGSASIVVNTDIVTPQQPVASTSKVTLEDTPVNKQDLPHQTVHGEGSKEEPFTLDDEDEAALDANDVHNSDEPSIPSTSATIIQRHHSVEHPDIQQPSVEVTAQDDSTVQVETAESMSSDTESETIEAEEPQDMYCLLCKTVVPASDVPGHRTTILHQLSKSSYSKDSKPLIPPTHYGVRSSNIGYGMLQRLGWEEEKGLGSSELGRKTPLKASDKHDRKGLGVDSKRKYEEEEKEGKIVNHRQVKKAVATAKPLAKNRKELERAKKKEMQMFKEGLAYFNT